MKRSSKFLVTASIATTILGGVYADPHLKISAGFKLPFAAADIERKEKSATRKFGEVAAWEPCEDFKFEFTTENSGVVVNLKPRVGRDGTAYLSNNGYGTYTSSIGEYSAWFDPIKSLRVSFGTSDERHWYKGTDERVNNKPGEITIIDCDDDSKTGVYYGLIGQSLGQDDNGNAKIAWDGGRKGGSVGSNTAYGWDSCDIGGATNLRVSYKQDPEGEDGFFAKAALVQHGKQDDNSNIWSNYDNTSYNSYWVPEVQAEVGYGIDGVGSIEAIYKTPSQGANVAAVYFQPRLLDGDLLGTLGFTFANNTNKGYGASTKNHSNTANKFTAFGIDARLQYNVSEKLKTFLYVNYSQITPGKHGEAPSAWNYTDKDNEYVDGKAETGGYVIGSVGYTLPVGYVNLDAGVYFRDLDNNDGYDLGENFSALKGSWTYWCANGAGVSLGGAWYHRLNTGDYDKTGIDGALDEIKLGAYFEVWLNN